MKPELREKILRYNRAAAEKSEKAKDLEVLLDAFRKLPPGQFKKVFTDDVISVFEKYGIEI